MICCISPLATDLVLKTADIPQTQVMTDVVVHCLYFCLSFGLSVCLFQYPEPIAETDKFKLWYKKDELFDIPVGK